MGVDPAQLHAAVERGDLAVARELLTLDPDVVDRRRGETRAIHMAILRRDLPMTELLLEHGADPEGGIWPNRDATGPMIMARERGYDEISAALRAAFEKRGGRGPQRPNEATRKLREAYLTGDEEAMAAVFEQNPELADMCPPSGVTLLHQMAGHGALQLMKWLIDRGADVNKKSQQGWTPLDFAAMRGAPNLAAAAEFLIDQGAHVGPLSAAALDRWDYLEKCSKQDLEQKGVLEAAVKGGHPGVLQRLLDLGLDPDERTPVDNGPDQSAGGPLYEAVIRGRLDMAQLLLDRGANPNASVWCSGSPTYKAYEAGNTEMIALLTQHGGWIDPGSAGYARQTEITRKMLNGEIDPHFTPDDFSGQTIAEQVLWGGASSRSAEIVKMALERIDWAPDHPRWFWMLWRPLPGHDDLTEQEQKDCCECFELILARCGPNHRAAESGQTMLHEAIARDHGVGLQLARILLDAGARLDVRDRLLVSTPLGWACRWGRTEIVKLLLARGADPIERDAETWASPRAWAEKMSHPEILALLAS